MQSKKGLIAFVVSSNYEVNEQLENPIIKLFGRLDNGESFIAITSHKPYFFIKKSSSDKALKILERQKPNTHITKKHEGFKNFQGEELATLYLNNPKLVPELRQILHDNDIQTYEADIRFVERFKIDNNIKSLVKISDIKKKETGVRVKNIFENPKIKTATLDNNNNKIPELKVLSLDIETNASTSIIYSIALYCKQGNKTKRVVLMMENDQYTKKHDKEVRLPEFVRVFRTQNELLKSFQDVVIKLDPDIITGWNVIDFDLKVISEAFKKQGLVFAIGRTPEPTNVRVYKNFFRESKAFVRGRVVVDGITLLRSAFVRLEDYKLETTAQRYLGYGKLLTGKERFKEIAYLANHDLKKLSEYNLRDAELVIDILEKTNALEVAIEKSMLTGLPIDRVSASIAAMDNLYLRALKKLKIAAITTDYGVRGKAIKGGYVMKPKPGLYDYVIVLDFKSLYPSIIRTFNIDPLSFKNVSKKCDGIKAPNNACFSKDNGILPSLLQELWQARDKAKKQGNDVKSHAIKILMNSFYGVLANPACRYYNPDIAGAVTAFGREIIQLTARQIENKGFKVIYSDTDSVFIDTKAKNLNTAKDIGFKLQEFINRFYKEWVDKNYGLKSYLNIEFEKVYKALLMPPLRGISISTTTTTNTVGNTTGAKKRYAGLKLENNKEILEIVGLEAIRRDWTELAKKFQIELLKRVFEKKEVEGFIQEFVKRLKHGDFNNLLVYKKAIRKQLSQYTKTTPPHVKAARKLGKLESNIIEYVMTKTGPEPVRKGLIIDYDHYIQKQLKPIADSILEVLGKRFEELVNKKSQSTLKSFG